MGINVSIEPVFVTKKTPWTFVLMVFISVCLVSNPAQGQDYEIQYQLGKQYYADGLYAQCIRILQPIIGYDEDNLYIRHASFFFGAAAYQLGYKKLALETFLQIQKLYPEWDQMELVHLWLAQLFYDTGNYFEALKEGNKITRPDWILHLEDHKIQSLKKCTDPEILRMLLEDNPTDTIIAHRLIRLLGHSKADMLARDSLIQVHHLNVKRTTTYQDFEPPFHIAILFPFLTDELTPTPTIKKNQQVLDLYSGMRLAQDDLKKENIDIELHAYETNRDELTIKTLLANPEMESMDMIVGPIFPEGISFVESFSKKTFIPLVINPLSSDDTYLDNNPYSFLYQPSDKILAARSAEYVADHITNKNCAVYYEDNIRDSLKASTFISRALSLGLNPVIIKKVNKNNSAIITEDFLGTEEQQQEEEEEEIVYPVKEDSIGSIYVASQEPLIFMKVISASEALGNTICVIGEENWFSNNSEFISKFSKTNVIFSAPNLIRSTQPVYQQFYTNYLLNQGKKPTPQVIMGYEFTWIIGHLFHSYGRFFQSDDFIIKQIHGYLTEGFLYTTSRSNGHVPLGKFENGSFVSLN